MPVVRPTRRLWKALGVAGVPPELPTSPPTQDCRLGDWFANNLRAPNQHVVVALNVRTYMAAVFPIAHTADFLPALARSVARQLAQQAVIPAEVETETRALLHAELAATNDSRVNGCLTDLLKRVEAFLDEGGRDLTLLEEDFMVMPQRSDNFVIAEDELKTVFGP